MRLGVDHLAETLRRVTGAATGVRPEQAAKLVADIDLDRPLLDAEQALVEMSRIYLDDAVWFHEPTYAAHLNCPVVVPALLAEVFVSAVNSSLDTFDQSVGGTFVERHLVDWTAQRIGFGPDADGIFTSGGTQSNLQALLLARDRALAIHGDPDAAADPRLGRRTLQRAEGGSAARAGRRRGDHRARRRRAPDGRRRARPHARGARRRPAWCRWPSSPRRAPRTSARSTRCPRSPACAARTTRGCTSTRRTAAACWSRPPAGTCSTASRMPTR